MALDLNDKTSNGNNLTNSGATEETTSLPFAQSTSAAILATTQYLTANDSVSLSITGTMTVEFWVMVTTAPGTDTLQDIISKQNTATPNRSWRFLYRDTGGTKNIALIRKMKEDIWQMITYCEYPTATMLNIRIGERVGGAVGCPNLQPFKKLVVQGETK